MIFSIGKLPDQGHEERMRSSMAISSKANLDMGSQMDDASIALQCESTWPPCQSKLNATTFFLFL